MSMWRIAILVCCLITPASAGFDQKTCAELADGDQKRVIKAIDVDSHGQASIQFDDNSCFFSPSNKADAMIRSWAPGDEVLILTEGKGDEMQHFQVINQSRGNVGVDPPTQSDFEEIWNHK